MTETVYLQGCSPTPLANYLKSLAVLRLVSAQKDSEALGYWNGEHFVLDSKLGKEELVKFFLEEYEPTPIVAPWNGGSGFFPKDRQTGIAAIEESMNSRLADYRSVISFCRKLVKNFRLVKRPMDEEKKRLFTYMRADGPEILLSWLDAVVVLTEEALRFPPLLGTGGNDGRLDFTNNFMQHLTIAISLDNGKSIPNESRTWLVNSIYGVTVPEVGVKASIGQFNPGEVGGPNASIGFEGTSQVNPWDFILMMEGSLLFTATTTRRLENTGAAVLSYPFTVRPTVAGVSNASKDDETSSRAEIWLPLWQQPTRYKELQSLFQESRVTVGKRPAEDGLDFVRAIASLGVDRGFSSFQRYGFVKRSGKAYLATPFGRINVKRNPDADLISDLEQSGFLKRLRMFGRSDESPGSLCLLVRRLGNSMFSLTQRFSRKQLIDILIVLGEIQRTLGISDKCRDAVRPVPPLSESWVIKANDGSPEFRLACSLAGLWAKKPTLPIRVHFAPVKANGFVWDEESRLAVWGEGRLTANLVQLVRHRLLEAEKAEAEDKPLAFSFGAFESDIAAFLVGLTNDSKIDALSQGLALCRVPRKLSKDRAQEAGIPLPSAYAILKPFFVPDKVLHDIGFLSKDSCLPLTGETIALLTSGRVDQAVDSAWLHLRQAGISLPEYPASPPAGLALDGDRLLAALVFPLSYDGLRKLLARLAKSTSEEKPAITK